MSNIETQTPAASTSGLIETIEQALDPQHTATDAIRGAEAAARMLIDHVSKHIAADAVERALLHLQSANHTELADAQPEQHCTARRIDSVADSMVEVILGLMNNESTEDASQHNGADQDVIDLDAAAALLAVHRVTLRRLACSGRIPSRKVGRAWRFSRQAILDWLAGEPTENADAAQERERMTVQAVSASFVQGAIRQGAR